VQRLEKRLIEGQAAFGSLITESMKMQNAIKNCWEHNKRDQQELERARASAVQQRAHLGEVWRTDETCPGSRSKMHLHIQAQVAKRIVDPPKKPTRSLVYNLDNVTT